MICASLNRPFFIKNLIRYTAEKILLLNTTNFSADYPSEEARSDQEKDAGARKADPSQAQTDGDVNIPAIVAGDRLNEIARERTLERDR